MSSTVEITKDNLQAQLDAGGILVLDVWAEWCGPCKAFGPIFESVAGKNGDVTFGKLDTEAEPELAGAMRIQSIPTLMVFRDGILVFRESGLLPEPALQKLVEEVRKLDMDDVRKQLEEAKEEAAQADD